MNGKNCTNYLSIRVKPCKWNSMILATLWWFERHTSVQYIKCMKSTSVYLFNWLSPNWITQNSVCAFWCRPSCWHNYPFWYNFDPKSAVVQCPAKPSPHDGVIGSFWTGGNPLWYRIQGDPFIGGILHSHIWTITQLYSYFANIFSWNAFLVDLKQTSVKTSQKCSWP